MNAKTQAVTKITELIQAGLVSGYNENLYFTDNYTNLQSRVIEYLLVVNIAQHLKNYTFSNGIRIHLEHPLNSFYNNAFPSTILTGQDIFDMVVQMRGEHAAKDSISKRLDIVLTKEIKGSGELIRTHKSFIGIEVKAINQYDRNIKKDVARLATGMALIDENGKNSIESCFVCFFKRLDCDSKYISQQQIDKGVSFEKSKWQNYFKQAKDLFPCLEFNLIDTNIVNIPVEEIDSSDPEFTHDDAVEQSGHINAYIIEITRKPNK